MRPITLALQGLRSYRRECTIDFTDRNLIAIVGDTGAGKSSILEAITYALYNCSTWSAGETKALIADGMQTMKVELVFLADGRRWKLLRSTSRGGYPPAIHRLECVDDPEATPFLGEDAVRRQVEKLLGMNRKAFLSAVILPQGRFQALLQEEPAERIRILKGIFRLTELEAVREQADVLRRRVEPVLAELRGRRAGLLQDPRAEVERLARELEETAGREKRLGELLRRAALAEQAARDAQPRLEALEEPAARLNRLVSGFGERPPARALAELARSEASLSGDIDRAMQERQALERQEHALTAVLEEAAGRREAYADLLAACQALDKTKTDLEELEGARVELEERRERLKSEATVLMEEAERLRRLEEAATAAARQAAQDEEELEGQRRRYATARELFLQALQSRRQAEDCRRAELEARQRLGDLQRDLEGERAVVGAAEEALTRARAELERVRRVHAAAHIAQGLAPGEPCPVCSTILPAGFQSPIAGELRPAEVVHRDAESEARRASGRLAQVEAAVRQAEQALAGQVSSWSRAEDQAAAHLAEFRQVLPDADLDRLDATVLRPMEARGQELAGIAKRSREAAVQARSAYDTEAGALLPRRQVLEREQQALQRDAQRIDHRAELCRATLAALPPFLKVPSPPTAAGLAPLLEEVAGRLEGARLDKERHDVLRATIRGTQSRIDDLRDRRREEVERPRERISQELHGLMAAAQSAHLVLGLVPPPVRLDVPALSELAAQADRLQSAAEQALQGLISEAGRLRQAVQAGLEETAALLREAGFTDQAALEKELERLKRAGGGIEAQLGEAQRQAAIAELLDRKIEQGFELGGSLQELCRLLGDGQFVRHVIERRQRTLLAVASETLGSMTGNRYGFSATFQIVDRLSGQPRSTKTLSGGETFLASLALALALVEIASRAGGRLDALFLDEGFGSLDTSALDEALGALERRASQGRLVAVVSHIKAVAERIEAVLEVTKAPTGSTTLWSDGVRNRELVEQELEAGLLS